MNEWIARDMWRLFEPVHAVVYFAREKKEIYDRAGLKGGWMGYFASRCAAMGPIGAEVATAVLYNFNPAMVARAIPDAWSFSSPARVLAARLEVADASLNRSLGEEAGSGAVDRAVSLIRRALELCRPEGRPLYAAHLSLEWPAPSHLALWHGCTLLREHRGDGHVASLVGAGIDGCEAHVLQAAAGRVPEEGLRLFRGWSEADWSGARGRLLERGIVDVKGALTDEGAGLVAHIDATADRAALAPWKGLGESDTAELATILRSFARRIIDEGEIVYPNPMGVPPPPCRVVSKR
ncbi:MAG: hypothetical protein M3285_05740 [Actinomycetota bacterium]|nr:hypothetical protein [Actinomycetota bacterium]